MAKLTITLNDNLQADFLVYVDAQNSEQGTSFSAAEWLANFIYQTVLGDKVMAFVTERQEGLAHNVEIEVVAEKQRLEELYATAAVIGP